MQNGQGNQVQVLKEMVCGRHFIKGLAAYDQKYFLQFN